MHKSVEPGLIRAFRYFTFIALCYYAVLIVFTQVQTGQGMASVQPIWYLNLVSNFVLFIYLSFPYLNHLLGKFYLPIAFALSAGVPLLSNLLIPYSGSPVWSVDPTWLTFPNLLVTVVLIAWQYSFSAVLIFIVCAAVLEMITVYPLVGEINARTIPLLGLPLLQAFALGLTGQIVSRMVKIQHAQRRELIRANIRLIQHAETLELLTVSRERNRLARELHDTLAHTLSMQAVNLEAVKLSLQPGQTETMKMLDQALKITRDGLTEVRRAIKDLRSLPLDDIGMGLAIRNLAMEASARVGFVLNLDIADPLPSLDPEIEQTIYRIVQEALTNVVNHAYAQQVTLSLKVEKGSINLAIVDDGKGIDLDAVDFESSHGLVGMKERAAMVNGKLDVISSPGNGTKILFSAAVPND